MTARAAAERHAEHVVAGDLASLMGDFAGNAFTQVMNAGGPPQPTTAWSILSEEPDGDAVRFHVRYANETEAVELRTAWKQYDGGAWKVFDIQKVDA